MNKAVLIIGPTASGKSQLALELAVARQLPILNVDSIQMYKGLKVGSALPSAQDMRLADHLLYAFVEKGEQLTAASYVAKVKSLLESKELKKKDLVFCGGSGFYLLALEKGMYPAAKADKDLQKEIDQKIENEGWEAVYQWILKREPELKRTVHLNDQYRIRRALEMILVSQKSPKELERELTPSPVKDYKKIKVGLFAEKEVLRSRVEKRAQEMLENGFIEEVQDLYAKGFKDWPPMQSVGYKEVGLYLNNQISRDELLPAIVLGNMKLIKKQLTWFKKDKSIHWFHVDKLAEAKNFSLKFFQA